MFCLSLQPHRFSYMLADVFHGGPATFYITRVLCPLPFSLSLPSRTHGSPVNSLKFSLFGEGRIV